MRVPFVKSRAGRFSSASPPPAPPCSRLRLRAQAPATAPAAAPRCPCPLKDGSLRFMVMGDTDGRSRPVRPPARWRRCAKQFPFEFAVMVGDNILRIGLRRRLQEEVRGSLTVAARGGREVLRRARQSRYPNQAWYALFQHGRPAPLHVPRSPGGAASSPMAACASFAIDSNYVDDKEQLDWLGQGADGSCGSDWKIVLLPPSALLVRRQPHGSAPERRASRWSRSSSSTA